MFHDLDEALRQLLMREIPVKNGEVDIHFDQPTRGWSAKLSRPTLNLFMHDLRENIKLRGSEQWRTERRKDGTASQHRNPVRVDVHYMITAWTNEPEDEHRLLARILMALFRQADLPEDLLPESLKNQPAPVALQVAQEDTLRRPADVWNALDNEMRPAVALVVTLTLDPYQPLVTPLVRSREIHFGQTRQPEIAQELVEAAGRSVYWTVGGTLNTQIPLQELRLTLVERGQNVQILEEGRFSIGKLRAGDYTLEVASDGRALKQYKITVPAPEYELIL